MSSVGQGVRRSGRLPVNKPVQVSGVNVEGRDFASTANTLMLSRHGAMVVMKQGLVPDQEIGVFNLETARDEAARVVAMFGSEKGSYTYGVEFLDPEVDFWNITFPDVSASLAKPDGASAPAAAAVTQASSVATETGSATGRKSRITVSEPAVLPPLTPMLIAELRPTRMLTSLGPEARDLSILLKCPLDGLDQWMLLHDRKEPLAEILGTRWTFDCPMHGVQMEFPVIANEGAVQMEIPDHLPGLVNRDDMGSRFMRSRPSSLGRIQTRYQEAKRVWVRGFDSHGNPFSQSTYSVNISRSGARLQGLGFLAGLGVELELKRNWKKALYQVVWMGQPGSSLANHVGVVCLQPEKNVWGLSEG